MSQIHGSGAGNWSNTAVVDNSLGTQQGRLYVNSLPGGFPSNFDSFSSTNETLSVTKGNLNKLRVRPRIQNEHVESSREALVSVGSNAGSIVTAGQVFKASQDNINSISLTLESAETFSSLDSLASGAGPTEKKLGTMEYSSNGSLQAEYIASNTLATRTTYSDQFGTTQDGNWAMALPMDVLADSWTGSIVSTDFTGKTIKLKYAATEKSAKASNSFFIGDGTNTKSIPLTINNKNTWKSFSIPETAMIVTANDLTAITPDITAITRIGFRVDKAKAGKIGHVDSITQQAQPNNFCVELWDLGSTEPAHDGTYNYTSGTQYLTIGDLGILGNTTGSLVFELLGGKRKYLLKDFVAGTAPEIPSNITLNSGNYYSLVFKYVDTNVNVYGPDTTFNIKHYSNGFAWSSTNNLITRISGANGAGSYSDFMFQLFHTDDVYLTNVSMFSDIAPSGNANVTLFTEDENMKISDIFTLEQAGGFGRTSFTIDNSKKPIKLNKGGKLEAYYNDDPTDAVSEIMLNFEYVYQKPQTNI